MFVCRREIDSPWPKPVKNFRVDVISCEAMLLDPKSKREMGQSENVLQ